MNLPSSALLNPLHYQGVISMRKLHQTIGGTVLTSLLLLTAPALSVHIARTVELQTGMSLLKG
jgi:hypothetical protein